MSYNSIYASANDQALRGRIEACCAQEGHASLPSMEVVWAVCTATDVEAAYASALAGDNPNPGGDEGVITDGMILANVQEYFTPPLPPAPPTTLPS